MANGEFDIKFTVGADTYGFMLVSPPGETKTLNVEEVVGPNADRITTEAAANHQDFDPLVDTPFAMDSFAGGVGQLEFDGEDENGYWWGSAVVTHVDGKAYLAPPVGTALNLLSATGNIDGFTTYVTTSGTRYDFCWSGTRIFRRDASNATNAWSEALGWTSPIADFTVFNGQGVISVPTDPAGSPDFFTIPDVTAAIPWTGSVQRNHAAFSAGTKPKYWLPVRGTLFALVDNQKVFYTVDPTQDGWAGPIETTVSAITGPAVGDSTYPFVGALAVNDYVFAFKQTAGYSIDAEQNVTEVFWQWKDKPSSENFKFVASASDLVVYSVGPEVYFYDPGTGMNLPMRLARQSGYSVQSILGLGADNQYVYVLAQVRVPTLRSAASVALLRGHRAGGTRWSFEVLWEDQSPTGKTYHRLGVLPFGVGTRLYWGKTEAGATGTLVMDISPDWDESTGSSFATSGTLYTSISRANFPGFVKRHLWLTANAESASASYPIAIAYSTDGGATFTTLTTLTAAQATTNYSNVNARTIVLRYTFSGLGSSTAVLRTFDHHQRVRYRYLPAITAGVRIADNIELLNGSRSKAKAATLRTNLETLRTTEERILYEDFTGNSFYCSVDKFVYRPTRHEKPESKYELEALVLINRADSGA